MNSFTVALKWLKARALSHLLTVIILALGVGLISASTSAVDAAKGAMSSSAARYPLVVGGKVGAIPLVLGSLTRMQDLSAGIPREVFSELSKDPRVEVAVPLLAGHAVAGFPLLGTTPDYLTPRERFPLSQGRLFEADTDEVVVGVEVAAALGLGLGAAVEIEHQHAGAPSEPGHLKVVGVLKRTGLDADRTLFCHPHAIYRSHGHAGHEGAHAEEDHATAPEAGEHAGHAAGHVHGTLLSAVLLRPKAELGEEALLSLQEELASREGLEVALTAQTLRRLADQLSTGGKLLELILAGILVLTMISLLLSMYATSVAHARDYALLRALGARRSTVVAVTVWMVALVSALGVSGGLGLSWAFGSVAERALREQMGLEATVLLFSGSTLQFLGALLLMLAVIGVQPALEAYGTSAIEGLSQTPGSLSAGMAWARRGARVALPLMVLVWLQTAMGDHAAEGGVSMPLDPASSEIFRQVADGSVGARLGEELTVRGWMYAVGDPFEVQDFYLVSMDPTLPRCPFCYRAPTARERIPMKTLGRRMELASSMVEVRGFLREEVGAASPWILEMTAFEVVIPE